MEHPTSHGRWSIAGGTILSILPNISSEEMIKTAVLAAVGASVSYLVSKVLKRIIR